MNHSTPQMIQNVPKRRSPPWNVTIAQGIVVSATKKQNQPKPRMSSSHHMLMATYR